MAILSAHSSNEFVSMSSHQINHSPSNLISRERYVKVLGGKEAVKLAWDFYVYFSPSTIPIDKIWSNNIIPLQPCSPSPSIHLHHINQPTIVGVHFQGQINLHHRQI